MRPPRLRRSDIAVIAIAFVAGEQEAWLPLGPGFSHLVGPRPLWAAISALAACALAWRRSAPVAVVTVIGIMQSAYYVAFGAPDGLSPILPLLFSLYATGRHGRDRDLWPALALAGVTLLVHQWRDPQPPLPIGPEIVFWTFVIGSAFLGRLLRSRAATVQTLARRAQDLERDQSRLAQEAVTAERERVARELHDLVGHGLSLMVLQVVRAQESLDRSEAVAAADQLSRLELTARNTLAEMRRLLTIIGDKASPLDPQPGVGDIEGLVATLREEGIPVKLSMQDDVRSVAGGVGLTVYRLIQESLTNVVKHAKGLQAVQVTLAREGDQLCIEVADTAEPVGEFRVGRGLLGMRERIALYGGSIHVGPKDDGFVVRAAVPLGPRT